MVYEAPGTVILAGAAVFDAPAPFLAAQKETPHLATAKHAVGVDRREQKVQLKEAKRPEVFRRFAVAARFKVLQNCRRKQRHIVEYAAVAPAWGGALVCVAMHHSVVVGEPCQKIQRTPDDVKVSV